MLKPNLLLFTAASILLPVLSMSQYLTDTLHNVIKQRDSILFEGGFNKCHPSVFEDMLSSNFEFYHDEGGATLSKAKFIAGFKENVCGQNYKAKRVLDQHSLTVYPLFHRDSLYGAVETGIHSFWAVAPGKPEYQTSVARFSHIWLLQPGGWKLSRAISYDHNQKVISPDFDNAASVNAWLKANNVPSVAIGIITEGVLRQVKVFGELEYGKPAPYNTIYNVASITKLITTMTTLRLVSNGKWDLDEPLHHWWVDADIATDPRSKTLTTRHILNQQSGFPNWRRELPGRKLALINTPGTAFGYSGEGFEYLRKALEKKFKTSFDSLVDSVLLKPLGLTDSKLTWNDAMLARFAIPHNAGGTPLGIDKNTTPNAADLLKTTVPDLAKFLIAAMHSDGLTKDVAAQMVAHATKTKDNRYIGLGWFIYDLGNGEYALSHGGDDEGSHSICFILPKTGDGLIIFSNSDNAPKLLYPDIIRTFLGQKGQQIIDIEMK